MIRGGEQFTEQMMVKNPSALIGYSILSVILISNSVQSAPPKAAKASLYAVPVDAEPIRIWTNCFGEFAERNLVSVSAGMIALSDTDSKVTQLPMAGFIDEDIAHIQAVLTRLSADDRMLGASPPKSDIAQLRQDAQAWRMQLSTWAREMSQSAGDAPTVTSAWESIRSIRDPEALKALDNQLDSAKNLDARVACLEAVAGIGTDQAIDILVREAVCSKDDEITSAAAMLTRKLERSPQLLSNFAKWIRTAHSDSAIFALRAISKKTLTLQSAAEVEVIESLVGKLTVHKREQIHYRVWSGFDTGWVPLGNGASRRWNYSVRPATAVIYKEHPNPLAYDLLTSLTGHNYGYDRTQWRKWLKSSAESAPASKPSPPPKP